MDNQLIISAVGPDRLDTIQQISRAVADAGCTTLDSRMTVLGGDFGIQQRVSGRWDMLAKLETHLPAIARELGLHLHLRRTRPPEPSRDQLSYAVDVIGMNQPGVVHHIARFFGERRIRIRDLASSAYTATHTETPMLSVHLTIDLDASSPIAPVREEFFDYCDQHNLDAIFEPVKN